MTEIGAHRPPRRARMTEIGAHRPPRRARMTGIGARISPSSAMTLAVIRRSPAVGLGWPAVGLGWTISFCPNATARIGDDPRRHTKGLRECRPSEAGASYYADGHPERKPLRKVNPVISRLAAHATPRGVIVSATCAAAVVSRRTALRRRAPGRAPGRATDRAQGRAAGRHPVAQRVGQRASSSRPRAQPPSWARSTGNQVGAGTCSSPAA